MNTEGFVELIQLKHVQVKIKLNKLDSEYQIWGVLVKTYHGKEEYVWCDIEPLNDGFSDLTYKVFCNPMDKNYKGKEFYTMDLISLISDGFIKLRVKYDKKYNDNIKLKP